MTWALFGSKALAFLKQVPIWVWILIVFLITLQWTKMSSYRKGKDDAADAIRDKQAKVKEAVVERVDDIATEERSNADAALEARNTGVHYPSASELPDDLAGLGFRNPRGGPAS